MLNLVLIRNLIVIVDFEDKKYFFILVHSSYIFSTQMMVIMGTQIIKNISLDYKLSFP